MGHVAPPGPENRSTESCNKWVVQPDEMLMDLSQPIMYAQERIGESAFFSTCKMVTLYIGGEWASDAHC
jgi:hypothetical protein